MADETDILALPLILPAQAQKHVTHNEALLALDALVQLSVIDRHRSAAPPSPVAGDRHLVAAGASGAWSGQAGAVAVSDGLGWRFYRPAAGWRAWVEAEEQLLTYDGSAWLSPADQPGSCARLGISASADTANRLAVASPGVLMTHAGAGVQLKLNKATPGDTASLLFQTNWSGRAEMGTTGSDGFAVKVSPDGSAWTIAMQLAGSGIADFPAGLTRAGHLTYDRGSVLGTVSQSAGAVTGALIERGSDANGSWLRLADGSQICWREGLSVAAVATAEGAGFASAALSWTFPKPFHSGGLPVVSGQSDVSGCWLSAATASTTSVSLRLMALVARSGATGLRALAVGRWF